MVGIRKWSGPNRSLQITAEQSPMDAVSGVLLANLFNKNDNEHACHDKVNTFCVKGNEGTKNAAKGCACKPVRVVKQRNKSMNQPGSTSGWGFLAKIRAKVSSHMP